MATRHASIGAIILVALAASGCSSVTPASYATTMPVQDPKWNTPDCQRMRADAATYESREKPASAALIALGPYGMAILAAAKDHQAKKRKEFMRDMHLACSSQPLPAKLQKPAPAS